MASRTLIFGMIPKCGVRSRHLKEATDGRYKYKAVQGDSFIAIVEFANPPRAKVLTAYGNATQSHSPHIGDQLALYSRGELRDAWLTREAVEANLAERLVLTVP